MNSRIRRQIRKLSGHAPTLWVAADLIDFLKGDHRRPPAFFHSATWGKAFGIHRFRRFRRSKRLLGHSWGLLGHSWGPLGISRGSVLEKYAHRIPNKYMHFLVLNHFFIPRAWFSRNTRFAAGEVQNFIIKMVPVQEKQILDKKVCGARRRALLEALGGVLGLLSALLGGVLGPLWPT